MEYSFTCYGHENITARHKVTLEFTKDKGLSLNGDCVIGVKSDFSLTEIKKFIKSLGNNKKVTIIIKTINNYSKHKIIQKISAEINPDFNSDNEMVIRKSDFVSERTFAVKADKAACDLSIGLREFLTDGVKMARIIIKR